MNRFAVLAILTMAAALNGAAPVEARDSRLASRLYNPDEVVRIDGRSGVQATIAFAADEHIENVAIGDANLWQVTPNKRANLLFIKPLAGRGRTNLTVVTDRRTYFFDLVASPTSSALYVLRFTYPQEPRAAQVGQEPAYSQRGERHKKVATLDFGWRTRGKGRLLPSRIYDDGSSTYVTWPKEAPIPAILIRNEKGEEGPVNFAVHGDVVVIDGVPNLLVLRSGKESAIVEKNREPRTRSRAAMAVARLSHPEGH